MFGNIKGVLEAMNHSSEQRGGKGCELEPFRGSTMCRCLPIPPPRGLSGTASAHKCISEMPQVQPRWKCLSGFSFVMSADANACFPHGHTVWRWHLGTISEELPVYRVWWSLYPRVIFPDFLFVCLLLDLASYSTFCILVKTGPVFPCTMLKVFS